MAIRRLVDILIVIQIGIIGFLILRYFVYKPSVLSVNTLNNNDYVYDDTVRDFYYDFSPNKTVNFNLFSQNIKNQYVVNADGLAESVNYSTEKPEGTYRIISLGDSFTFGLHIPQNQNFSKVLEKQLNNTCKKYQNYEVINFGVPGYDLRFAADKFIQKGKKYNPDMIVWWVGITDIETYDPEVRKLINIINSKSDVPRYDNDSVYTKAVDEIKEKKGENYFFVKAKDTFLDLDKNSKSIKKLLIAEDGTVQVIGKGVFNNNLPPDFESLIVEPSLEKNRDILKVPGDGHPSVKGHEVLAQNIFINISKNIC